MRRFTSILFLYIIFLGGINAKPTGGNDDDLCTEYFRVLAGRGDKFANLLGDFIEKRDKIMQYQSLAPLSGFDKQYFISTLYGEQTFYALRGNFATISEAEERVYSIQKRLAECLYDYKFYVSAGIYGNTIYIQNPSESEKAQSRVQVILDAATQQYFAALIIEIRNIEIPVDAIAYTDRKSLVVKNYNMLFRNQFLSIIDSSYNGFNGLRLADSVSEISNIYDCNCELDGAIGTKIEANKNARFYAVFLEQKSPETLSKRFTELRQEIEGSLRLKYPDYKVEMSRDNFNNINKYIYTIPNHPPIELGIYQVNLDDENSTEKYQIRLEVF